jgi:hypothetical protein
MFAFPATFLFRTNPDVQIVPLPKPSYRGQRFALLPASRSANRCSLQTAPGFCNDSLRPPWSQN